MPRLRQVALVARDLEPVVAQLRTALDLPEPYRDPDVAVFGLENAVFAVGDCFLEVVSPVRDDTAAGRHLQRLGGDGGYMAIFQVEDFAAARERVRAAGVRVAWEIELDDISGMHLHPADVPGAIVSLDEPRPPESWRWAGPDWTGRSPLLRNSATGTVPGAAAATGTVPVAAAGAFRALCVAVADPAAAAARWAEVLGEVPREVEFVPGERGIVSVTVEHDGPQATYEVGGIRVSTVAAA